MQDVINNVNFIYNERVGEGGHGVENKSRVQDDWIKIVFVAVAAAVAIDDGWSSSSSYCCSRWSNAYN